MAKLSSGQQAILGRLKRIGREVGATPKEIKAAVETGLVESNLRNLPGGDADSAGWRQERASIYKDPTNLDASIRRFFSETAKVRDQHSSSGSLAAAVQRPAAQYRGRYGQRASEAQALLAGGTPRSSGGATARMATAGTPGTPGRTITTTTPGVDNSATRNALLSSFLNDKNSDILDFATQIQGLSDTPATSSSRTIPGTPGTPGTPGSVGAGGSKATADQLVKRADAIDQQHLPYKWGGGHAGQTSIHAAVPLDCSGAVSKVLGIDPRVADQFKSWGSPGDGGNSGVTVYSKPTHTLMKIGGHFFGTSASNPGGGAGWIPQSAISPEYLKGFTARHSAR